MSLHVSLGTKLKVKYFSWGKYSILGHITQQDRKCSDMINYSFVVTSRSAACYCYRISNTAVLT